MKKNSSNFKVNFLCVGFQKCATTTIDAVLRQHSQISLPCIKEIHLDMWYDRCENPIKVIENKFFGECSHTEKRYGIVDPEFENNPKVVYDCIGTDVKLIFMMRNPVDRLFSFYKMALQLGFPRVYRSTLNGKKIRNVRQSFGRYVREELKNEVKNVDFCCGNYIDTIQEFEKYYKRENMKFIIFEQYLNEPEKIIKEIFDFLELPCERVDFNTWVGKGKISKNRICFRINYRMNLLREYARCNPRIKLEIFQRIDKLCSKIFSLTTVGNEEKMNFSTRKALERYYKNSKDKLQEYLKMDLSEWWF